MFTKTHNLILAIEILMILKFFIIYKENCIILLKIDIYQCIYIPIFLVKRIYFMIARLITRTIQPIQYLKRNISESDP